MTSGYSSMPPLAAGADDRLHSRSRPTTAERPAPRRRRGDPRLQRPRRRMARAHRRGRQAPLHARMPGADAPAAAGPDVHYLFAPLKHARLDYMVQKATEMGVAHLQPVLTRRTVAARVNLERMRANAIEAAEQCGVLRVPTVGEPVKLEAVLASLGSDARARFSATRRADVASPLAALSGVWRVPLAVLIGPEGGFDPAERALLREQAVRAADLARAAHHARRHGGGRRAGAGQRRARRLALARASAPNGARPPSRAASQRNSSIGSRRSRLTCRTCRRACRWRRRRTCRPPIPGRGRRRPRRRSGNRGRGPS